MYKELPDFDTLMELARKDPQGLEKLRQEHVDAVIESAPPATQRRLRGLQFQIDAQRRLHPTPLAACMKVSQMMFDSFTELRYLLNEFSNNPNKREPAQELLLEPALADVLEFRRPCTAVEQV